MFQIVASNSRVGVTLLEMNAKLTKWAALAAQDRITGEWPDKLAMAQLLLTEAKSMPHFLAMVEAAGI
jgi:hypothetical protein